MMTMHELIIHNFQAEIENCYEGLFEEGMAAKQSFSLQQKRFGYYRYLHQLNDILIQYESICDALQLNDTIKLLKEIYNEKLFIFMQLIYQLTDYTFLLKPEEDTTNANCNY